MRTGLTHQRFHGQIVQDITLIVDQSILPVRRKGIKATSVMNRGRKLLFHRPHRRLAIPFGFQDSRASSVFFSIGVTGTGQWPGS